MLVNSYLLLSRLRSKPIDKSSDSLLDGNNLYIKETMCAWLTSSKCLPELVVNLFILNKAITARLTNLFSAPSANLLPVAACNTSKFSSR